MDTQPKTRLPTDPRLLAWKVLCRVEAGAKADVALGQALVRAKLTPADRALAVRLVYGTLSWQLYLDHLLAGFCHRPLVNLDPAIRVLLRMALFQICFLDKVPTFAAVDTAVELAKRHRRSAAAGLVNAVLRRAAQGWTGVPLPARARDVAAYLSVRYSHPRWVVEAWLHEYGEEETEQLLRANNEPAPTVLRANRLRTTRESLLQAFEQEGTHAKRGTYSPDAIIVSGFDPARHPFYAQGLYSVQGEAAQLISYLLAPRADETILDLCAAPGGKTTHLAEMMRNRGRLIAVDSNRRGIERLRRECERLGICIVDAHLSDVRSWRPEPNGAFDRVLLDAPCSGLGTLRQHPEIRWRRTPESIEGLAQLQRQLLNQAALWVRPGGILLYATCTLLRRENEDVVEDFLARQPEFKVTPPGEELPASVRSLIDERGIFRSAPHRHMLDGFFAVRLRRCGNGCNVTP